MKQKFKVFISGQKYFGQEILSLCLDKGYEVVGVCCPLDDKYIGRLAKLHNIPILPAGMLTYDTMPSGVDLGITVHSFDYIGKRTRYKTRLGWIGYHPSLLPRHRGRSAIEWAIRMRDIVAGGSVYWLNAGIDRGDITQRSCKGTMAERTTTNGHTPNGQSPHRSSQRYIYQDTPTPRCRHL